MQPGDLFTERSALGVHLVQIVDVFQTLQVRSDPRVKGLPGGGVRPRPLIELLRASDEDGRGLRELSERNDGALTVRSWKNILFL